jgi:ribosome modulation factor
MDPELVDEGVDAYCAGIPRAHCPYPAGSSEHDDWLHGWDEASRIDQEEVRPLH